MQTKNTAYIPGTCNIGDQPLRKRKIFALVITLLTVSCIFFLEIFHISKIWKLLMFIPFALSVICWLQVFVRFCVYFGLTGLFKINEQKAISIENKNDLHRDKVKAIIMIVAGILVGLALTLLYFFLST